VNTANGALLTVVSAKFAPQVSGTTILVANLLSAYASRVNVLTGFCGYTRSDPSFQPPCPTRSLPFARRSARLYGYLRRQYPEATCRILQRLIAVKLRELDTDVVMAVFPDDVYLVASFLAARALRLPFYVHMHDLWVENASASSALGRFAEKWEAVILKDATRVLCMTEAMQKHYQDKYGVGSDLLPHCIAERDYLTAPSGVRPPRMPKLTVLFVGGLSPAMNLDALKVLASASELLPVESELVLCTPTSPAFLKGVGISSSRLSVKYVSRAEVQQLQSGAHVLVAPLSHKNCSVDEVRTVFSTKLLEYLIAGRPIVVFAPEGSHHAESARKNGWGYVVSEDSPTALAAGLLKVATDTDLAARLVRGALQEARLRSARYHAGRLREWVLADASAPGDRRGQVTTKTLARDGRV
jgi:glycosyltransferase involved in cell wall biosynthesis